MFERKRDFFSVIVKEVTFKVTKAFSGVIMNDKIIDNNFVLGNNKKY